MVKNINKMKNPMMDRIKNRIKYQIENRIKYLEASLTVEAALVMSAMFLFIASLLTGVFEIHERVTGNMVLQEALERYVHLEKEEEGQSVRELQIRAEQDFRGYFWCGGGRIALREAGNRLEGEAEGKTETKISVKRFDPENFLRLLRAAGV